MRLAKKSIKNETLCGVHWLNGRFTHYQCISVFSHFCDVVLWWRNFWVTAYVMYYKHYIKALHIYNNFDLCLSIYLFLYIKCGSYLLVERMYLFIRNVVCECNFALWTSTCVLLIRQGAKSSIKPWNLVCARAPELEGVVAEGTETDWDMKGQNSLWIIG